MSLAIYVISSVALSCLGCALLAFSDDTNTVLWALGNSFLAGGLSSIAFSLIKYFDDKSSKQDIKNISNKIECVNKCMNELIKGVFVVDDPEHRCAYKNNLTEEFNQMLYQYKDSNKINIDIMGLSLNKFYKEQYNNLIKSYNNLNLRIIIQNPNIDITKQLVKMEGRDLDNVISDINEFTKTVLKGKNTKNINIEIRWFNGYPSISFNRVNDTTYVRARFLGEANGNPVFFEKYMRKDKRFFDAYQDYFDAAWKKSSQLELDSQGGIVVHD